MSNGFESIEHISRPVEEVWAGLTDWKQAPTWMNGIEEMRGPEPEGPVEGQTVFSRARGAERQSTIVVWSPPRRLVLRSQQGGVSATMSTHASLKEAAPASPYALAVRCERWVGASSARSFAT